MEALLFWTFTAIALAGAIGVVAARNPVHGAVSLVGALFALAGLFLLLEAQLVAALQVLVYAGAIMVLFLFVIMLLNLGPKDLGRSRFGPGKLVGILASATVVTVLLQVVRHLIPVERASTTGAEFGTVAGVGRLLYTTYTLPFEVVSLLLLTAIVASVVVAKGRI